MDNFCPCISIYVLFLEEVSGDEGEANIVWEDNWDDDTIEDDFSNQLRFIECRLDRLDKIFCIPESFNTNISRQFFDYPITFVNSQH